MIGAFQRFAGASYRHVHRNGEAGRRDLEWCTRSIEATRRGSSKIAIELFDGDWEAARWPSISADSTLEMSIFQSREFLEIWMRTIGRDRRVRPVLAVVADEDGRPVLYLPLAIEMKFGVTLLRFMDAGVSDLNAPVVARGRDLTEGEFAVVWKEILAQLPPVDVIDLRKMPVHLNGVRNPLTYLPCDPGHGHGYAVLLSNLPEVHERASMVRTHKKLRRQLQRLTERGPVRFVSNPAGETLRRTVDGLFDLKRMQYMRTWGRDFLETPGINRFYREMSEPGRLGCISHLSALTCGESLVSAHLGFIGRNRFYYVMPAYDVQYRALAPGCLLLDHLMTQCRDAGYEVFDLGEGEHAYKGKWVTDRVPLRSYQRAVTFAGTLYLQANRIRRHLDIRVPEFSAGASRQSGN
jgi:CelD/BcsL family acetyltransferase involved in cellulose biosynthesis